MVTSKIPNGEFPLNLLSLQEMSPAVVFGHADADGHLAAEQTRSNLEAAGVLVREVIVGPETRNYRFWERGLPSQDFSKYRLVVFVDIAFNFKDPDKSLEAVLKTADDNPETQFVLIDHHPLKMPQEARPNLKLIEVGRVYDCCLGIPSDEMMVVAAICDGDGKAVASQLSPVHERRARGVRRAAADTHGVAGHMLLSLLRLRNWEFFEALADEPSEMHLSARGYRKIRGPKSLTLEAEKLFRL